MKIIIDHERYGVRSVFGSLEEAHSLIRGCGPDFQKTQFTIRPDGAIVDEDGNVVGTEEADEPANEEEYHTPRVWEQIARRALKAGDQEKARISQEAADLESRSCGAE